MKGGIAKLGFRIPFLVVGQPGCSGGFASAVRGAFLGLGLQLPRNDTRALGLLGFWELFRPIFSSWWGSLNLGKEPAPGFHGAESNGSTVTPFQGQNPPF